MNTRTNGSLKNLLEARFGDGPDSAGPFEGLETLARMAARGSCRSFLDRPVEVEVLQTLSAIALASPTKSDLQQRDIVIVTEDGVRDRLVDLVRGQAWVAAAPPLIVFCGNNRRQRLLHGWRSVPFANDHLDAFFNAAVDAAVALGAFVTAAEAAGLGCCPISAVRNEARAVSDLLRLPDHVFPVAGLAVGYPSGQPEVSMRMPLTVTVHRDAYAETGLQAAVEEYCQRRATAQPYGVQRFMAEFGSSASYDWAEDKVRQYSKPERADFGEFILEKGFKLPLEMDETGVYSKNAQKRDVPIPDNQDRGKFRP